MWTDPDGQDMCAYIDMAQDSNIPANVMHVLGDARIDAAEYIAAANPVAVLELIERLREGESYNRMFEAACYDLGLISEHLKLDPNDGGCDPIIGAIENLEGQRDGLLAALSDIKHRSEMMRIWTGQEWKYHPFHASVIHKFAEDAIAEYKEQP